MAPRLKPSICLYSEQLPRVVYDELGGVLKMLGFDGCVIGVLPGGHVTPEHADLDLMRSVEAITGVGLVVPAIAVPYTSNPQERTVRLALAVAGEMGVPFFRPGDWKAAGPAPGLLAPAGNHARDVMIYAAMARQVGTAIAFHSGDPSGELSGMLRQIDAHTAGYDFDPCSATQAGGAEACLSQLKAALPRLKMVSARDAKQAPCPLGEGNVDWPKFLAVLAEARYTGPVTIYQDFKPGDELAAVRKDLAFLKKQIDAAYGS